MKKLFYILLLLGSTYVFAQNKGMTYQAVIYAPGGQNVPGVNVANVPLTNRTICLQFSLLDASSGIEYQEVVKTKTDEFGMVNITIGSGTQTGGYASSFGAVVWSASADKSMKVALDATGLCNQYEELSVEKLDAVPFANAAITAGNVSGVVALANGGTGATTAAGARTNLGIGNVDNTSDLNKPMSTATKTYVDSQLTNSTIVDADANTKGKVQLAGDLAGTAAAPTVPGLALKENAANKSTTTTLGTSNVLFPTQNAVKTYVDTAIAGATIVDADANTKGKIRLAGDLSGTAAAPTVPGLALKLDASLAGVPNGIATLNSAGIIPANQLPPISVASTNVVGSQAAMLALSNATVGSIAVRTDVNKNFILSTAGPSVLANWIELLTPGAPVQSVNGLTGAIQLSKADINLANVDNTSDAAKPVSTATQNALNLKLNTNQVGVPNGTASLNALGKIPTDQIPAISFSSVKVLGSQAEMLAQTNALIGSVVIRTDVNKNYVLAQSDPTILANWVELLTPAPPVQSVNGYVGNVSLTKADLGLGNVDNTGDINKPVSTPTQNALDLKANLASPTFTGTVSGITKSMVGLANVDNTTDLNKPVSTATQTALDLKANTVDLTAETTRATAAETTLTTNVATNATAIAAETTRATAAEALKANATDVTSSLALKEDAANKTLSVTTDGASDVKFPSAKAVKTYVDTAVSGSTTSVPYTGASGAVNLGAYDLTVNGLKIGKGNNAVASNTALGSSVLTAVTTGGSNGTGLTAIGSNALKLNTTGYSNTAVGNNSLTSNTTGGANTAIGAEVLKTNQNGSANSGLGDYSLNKSTGSSNTAIGSNSLSRITTGSDNTAIGYASGMLADSGGSPTDLTIANKSVFIGHGARANANSSINEIVMGYNAIGNGNNTVTIGNSSVTGNYFNGNINLTGTVNGGTWNGTEIAIAKGGTGQTTKTAAFDALSPMTTAGDIIYGQTNGTGTRLAKGNDGQVLKLVSGLPSWQTVIGFDKEVEKVNFGANTGFGNQANLTTAVGPYAGQQDQGLGATALGRNAGNTGQGAGSVAVGQAAGAASQGAQAVAIGNAAGASGQREKAIAIGELAGYANQHANSIILNATGAVLNSDNANALYIAPIRTATNTNVLLYNPTTKEVTTSANILGNAANVTGTVAIANGGTGSTTQNFVDLTTTQTVAGAKTFSSDVTVNTLSIGLGGGTQASNTVLGNSALANNTSGGYSVALGFEALKSNTTANSNTAIGNGVMAATTTGGGNVAIGMSAMSKNTIGQQNTAIGQSALYNNTDASANIAIGNSAGAAITTGGYNTIIGTDAAGGLTTGSRNTIIGRNVYSGNVTDNIIIGNGQGQIKAQHDGTSWTLGTIGSGVWNGTEIAIAKGGTGATTAAAALTNLGAEPTANKSTATNLGATTPSDDLFPTQKAVKTYVDAQTAAAGVSDGSITSAKILDGTIAAIDIADGTITGAKLNTNLYAAGKKFTFQDLLIGAGTTFGKISTDGTKHIAFEPTYNVESTRFWGNGNITIQTGGTFTDNGYKLEVAGTTKFGGNATIAGTVTGTQFTSTIATGTAPFVVTSTTPVANLSIGGNAANVTGTVAIANGGTGSTTQNFVDLTTAQTIAGAKTFSSDIGVNGVKIGLGGGSVSSNFVFGNGNTLRDNSTGSDNMVFGQSVGMNNTTGDRNLAIGSESFRYNTNGSHNVGLGYFSLRNNSSGSYNIAIGENASQTNTSGSYTTTIGYGADVASNNLSNATAIGNGAIVNASNTIQLGNTSVTSVKTSAKLTSGTVTYPNTDGTSGQVLTTNGSGTLSFAAIPSANLASGVTGILPVANGGTGSATQNFVDLTTDQTIAGVKTLSSDIVVNSVNIGLGKGAVASNTAVGKDAISATATGAENTAIGNNALKVVTSGARNTALGFQAAIALTTGIDNTALGYRALSTVTSSQSNTAIGNDALRVLGDSTNDRNTAVGTGSFANLTTGQYNVGVGQGSLLNATSGSNNVAVGKYAGFRATNDSGVSTSNKSIFIGSETKSLNPTSDNEIVIGYDGRGLGNNSTVLGNSLITQAKIFGALNLPDTTTSTTTTSGALTVGGGVGIVENLNVGGNAVVTGTIKIAGGAPAAGKVLTSDANGVASWTAIPSTVLTSGVAGILPVDNGGTGLTSITAGQIPFGNGTSALGASSNLFWDNTNSRLGIGTSSPTTKLEVNGSFKAGGITYPSADGTSGQYLKTDGSGALGFTSLITLPSYSVTTRDAETFTNGSLIFNTTAGTIQATVPDNSNVTTNSISNSTGNASYGQPSFSSATQQNVYVQTFTTSSAVNLVSISLNAYVSSSPATAILKVFNDSNPSDGLTNQIGTVSKDISSTSSSNMETFTLSSPYLTTANATYTFVIYGTNSSNPFYTGAYSSDNYSGGTYYTSQANTSYNASSNLSSIGLTNFNSNDLKFNVNYATGASASRWVDLLSTVDLTTNVSGSLPIANGGTGSTTKNFVDLTSAQTISGVKTFSDPIAGSITGNAATVTNGVYTTDKISALAATSSSELKGVISDESGSGALVFATSPTLVTPTLGVATATSINGLTPTAQTTGFTIAGGTTSKTLTVSADATVSGTNTGDQTITLTGDVTGTGTGSFATTVGKINGTSLAGLATGILKNTTTTGVPSIAVAADFPTLNQSTTGNAATATTATNIAGGAIGSVPYQSAAGTTALLAGNTTTTAKFLTSTGTGTAATAPTWTTISAVPYTGATGAVNLGAYDLTVNGLTVGLGAGSITTNTTFGKNALEANTTGATNSAFGDSALKNNLTGENNTAVGANALDQAKGSGNTAVGSNSQSPSTGTFTGSNNTSLGFNSLNAITTGSYNIAVGQSAMYALTSGNYNTVIGDQAGATIASNLSTKTAGNNGIYIGYRASPLADSTSNEIVIGATPGASGYNTGLGTNSTVIGNSSTQQTKIYGALTVAPSTAATATDGLNTTIAAQNAGVGSVNNGGNIILQPGSQNGGGTTGIVQVNGQLKITGGTPGVGKVLTSDANGLATWTNASGSAVTTSTASYQITLAESIVFYTGSAAGTFAIPDPATTNAGKEITIKNKTAFGITITPTSTGKIYIDNANTAVNSVSIGIEASNNWIKLVSDGSQWNVLRALF